MFPVKSVKSMETRPDAAFKLAGRLRITAQAVLINTQLCPENLGDSNASIKAQLRMLQ